MKVVAFLPVKGSSERIENKNVKILDGKPLFLVQLEKLIKLDFIDEIYLDTESDEIIQLASLHDCKVLKRDPELANNRTDGNMLFYNEVRQVDADIYIQILATSPFISADSIKRGIEVLSKSAEYDSVILVRKEKMYTWNSEGTSPNYNIGSIPNSKDLPDTVIETMGLYMVKADIARKYRRRIGEKPYLLEAQAIEAIDVNYPDDFELANYIAAGMREKERRTLKNLASLLSSALLSDILDELDVPNQVVSGYSLNVEGKKILGRAKTLKLKKAASFDSTSIYDALYSYNTIVPNDIIVVENDVPEYAYFGELNANLAIRSGAIGAIIGGLTRDHVEVTRLGFPVFSKGYTCRDVKFRATVESVNSEINIEGVLVRPDDLIFADAEGVIVIPKNKELEVLSKAWEAIKREKAILNEVAEGIEVDIIRNRYGNF